MKRVTLRQLRVFAEVARHLSVTSAANALHLTQPAVTLQVKELEETCGVPLLERMGRRIYLTEAGRELAACAASVTERLRETEERLDALRGLKRGLLKIGAVSTAKYFAPSLLAAFTPSYPGVSVRFSVGNREETIRDLAGNAIDLAIMGRPPREIETVAEPFAKHPLIIIAPPSHPLARKRRIPLKRLEGENFLIREEGSGTRASMERVFRQAQVAYRASMEASSNETIKQAVIAGMGISFISAHTVGLELKTGKLAALDVAGLPVLRDWYVIYRRQKQLSPIAAAFRAFVLAHGARIIEQAVGR
jgi:DNA-binding transcriptional LysR family regulator